MNRLWLLLLVLWPQLDTTFGGDQTAMINTAAGASVWLSWMVNLLVAEWWLQRGRAARHQAPLAAQPPTVPSAPPQERQQRQDVPEEVEVAQGRLPGWTRPVS
ncbi:MAG: hypothetical protein ACRDTH_12810 [Pseudonocardiaceae bacterium]